MTVYARSDVMHVTVSRAHGGCGEPHSRPVRNGAPDKLWKLSCPQCQQFLASDPLWSGTLADVPDTPDEVLARDNVQKTTMKSRDDLMALAVAKLAGLPVAEFLTGVVAQTADQGVMLCGDGHENVPSAKFCGECGVKLHAEPPSTAAVTVTVDDVADDTPAKPAKTRAARQARAGRTPRAASEPRTPRSRQRVTEAL